MELKRLKNKRIILVLGAFEVGGSERQALLLARHLAYYQGAKIEIWGFGLSSGPLAHLCREHNIPCRLIPAIINPPTAILQRLMLPFNICLLAAAFRITHPDVIMAYTVWPNILCGLAWRLSGAKLYIWNQRDEGRGLSGGRIQRLAVALTPFFISNSVYGAHFLIQRFNISSQRIFVVPNGVEICLPASSKESCRSKLRVDNDSFLACMIANLHSFKDHTTLLKAWQVVDRRLNHSYHSPILMLAGRFDNMYGSLRALAVNLGIQDNVRFLGQVADISILLGAIDLGVFSSRFEGCPNGVLECMAAGLAVVATDIPGIREAVGPSVYRFLVPPGDAEALANKIIELAADPCLRAELGKLNAHRAREVFSLERMGKQTADLISGWLNRDMPCAG